MDELFSGGDDLFKNDDIAGKISKDALGASDGFMPWHKPRKQYVRENQWWRALQRIISSKDFNGLNTIKYFGLPGGDLLDVYYFSKKIIENGGFNNKKILIHGFINNNKDKIKAESRLSQILDMECIDSSSKVEKFDFCEIHGPNAVAYSKIKDFGGYHFVNLDFCDSVFKSETLLSLICLMSEQFRLVRDIPWLLCLTTRADLCNIDVELIEKLSKIYTSDIPSDPDLETLLLEVCNKIYPQIDSVNFSSLPEDKLSEALQLSFIYWIIAESHAKGCAVELASSMKYRVHKGNQYPDMYSYVFRFKKRTCVESDAYGLVDTSKVKQSTLTPEQKVSNKGGSIKKFISTLDIDAHLDSQPELMQQMVTNKKELLHEAGWDVSNYEEKIILV
jgi:hypothetical protein